MAVFEQVNELSEYQIESRAKVEETLRENMIHEPEKDQRHVSPCGRYMLLEKRHRHKEKGYWGYTEGIVYDGDEVIGSYIRNYGYLMFSWVTGHPDGHDYLVTSEDYQGQTLIRLDTRERVDFLDKNGTKGFGWIWAGVKPSPCKTMLAVEGCVWGGPYEIQVFDFTDPFGPELETLFMPEGGYNHQASWQDDSSLVYGYGYEHNLVLDKPEFEETGEDWDLMEKLEEEGKPDSELYENRVRERMVWRRD